LVGVGVAGDSVGLDVAVGVGEAGDMNDVADTADSMEKNPVAGDF